MLTGEPCTGEGMQRFWRGEIGSIQHNTIFFRQTQLLVVRQPFGNVVQNTRLGGILRVFAPAQRQPRRRLLAAAHMRYARGFEVSVRLSPQPRKIRFGTVQPAADDLGIHGVAEPFRTAALRQCRAKRRRIHRQRRFRYDLDPRAVRFAQIRRIPFDLRQITVGTRKRRERAERKESAKLIPLLHIEKHVRSDEKI